jgi:hypothetical protein
MKFKAALAADLRKAIVDHGNKAEKGLGDAINVLNEKWGTLLDAVKPMAQQAKNAAGKTIGTSIDGILLGAHQIPALATKKAFELMNTTAAKTIAGKALMEAGKNGMSGAMARRAIVDMQRAAGAPQQDFSSTPANEPDTSQSMGQQIQEANQGTPVSE